MSVKYFEEMPVVPMRGRVIFPDTVVSFDAGRLISLAAIKRAADGGMRLLVCAQPDSEKDEITEGDICRVGTVVKIKQITRLPSDSIRILAEGLCRVRVRRFSFDECFLAEADEINALSKRWEIDYTRYSGGSYSCEWAWAKMLHVLRHAPELREKAYSWVEHCDWMAGVLTGNTRPETMPRSRCVAGHKAMWHETWGGLPAASFFEAVDPLYNLFRGHLYTRTSTADECAKNSRPHVATMPTIEPILTAFMAKSWWRFLSR